MATLAPQFIPIFVIIFGLIIGSFLTVCIFRLPFASLAEEQKLAEEAKAADPDQKVTYFDDLGPPLPQVPHENLSLNSPPRSFCPSCFKTLRWWHNVPLFSWLLLRGRCNYCSAPISARYPVIELTSALFAILTLATYGLTSTGVIVYLFCCALIVITVIDYDYYIIPNVISLPGTVFGLVIAAVNHFFNLFSYPIVSGMAESLIGIAAGAGFLLIVSEFYLRIRKIEGLGMGDVKLLAMTGALFGPECSLYTIFVGSILGAVIGVALMLLGGRKMSHPLPFGPYLALATVIYLFGGPDIVLRTVSYISLGAR
ncbi:MAG: prepilin peptidase [Deltaproteobacteria bacterium]|nr:prepilin peptidase [Deltaproteobacteria bacterium]